VITNYVRALRPEERFKAAGLARSPFLADVSGAVASDFVMLSAALVMGMGVTLTTLTSSLGVVAENLSSDIALSGCNLQRSMSVSASLQKVTC